MKTQPSGAREARVRHGARIWDLWPPDPLLRDVLSTPPRPVQPLELPEAQGEGRNLGHVAI